MNKEYRLSGKPGMVWLYGLLVGPVAITILSIIYAYLDVYNPLIYLSVLVFIGYLVGLVLIVSFILHISKCRSKVSAYALGGLLGVFALYVSWLAFLNVLFEAPSSGASIGEMLASPLEIFSVARELALEGWFSVFSNPVSGVFLWIIWIIEALGILAAGIFGGAIMMEKKVFCENCNSWLDDDETSLRLSLRDRTRVNAAIEQDVSLLADVPLMEENESPHAKVNLHRCDTCDDLATVDVDEVTLEMDDDGDVSENEENMSPVFVVSDELYETLSQRKAIAGQ